MFLREGGRKLRKIFGLSVLWVDSFTLQSVFLIRNKDELNMNSLLCLHFLP